MEEDPLTHLRRAAALAAVALAVGAEIAAPAGAAWLVVLDTAVAVAFAAGAAAVAAASPRIADLALTVAVTWGLGTLAAGGDLPAAFLLLHRAPLTILVLVYPARRLRSVPRGMLALAAVGAPFTAANVCGTATAAVVGAASLLAAVDAARAMPVLRPPRAAAALAGAAVAATAAAGAADLADATALLVAYDGALLATAIGLLVPLARGRWSAAVATGVAVELGTGPGGAPITAGLAEVLGDPKLELRLRARGGRWTDEAGSPARAPEVRVPGRALTRRTLADGTEVALLHDAAAITDRAVAESAVAVAATAVENARREREVRDRIDHLRRLRRGLLVAADEERSQLEDELRLGPLREAEQIDALLAGLPGEQVAALRRELAVARDELTEIARGLYPAALARAGLASALAAAAERAPLAVEFDAAADGAPIPEPIALTAYYVATEALANVAKHAGATSARVELGTRDGALTVRVLDDGVGGADPEGGGLRGLRDRVATIDGEFRVTSPRGRGTIVEARLPL